MPRPVVTLWIVTAVALPAVGLGLFLTPQAPTLLSVTPIQPVLAPNANSSPNQPDTTVGKSLPSLAEVLTPKAESSLKKPSAAVPPSSQSIAAQNSLSAVPRQPVVTLGQSSPKKFRPITAPPLQPLAARTLPSVAARQFSADSSTELPFKKPEPAPTPLSKPIATPIPPSVGLRQPLASPEASLSPKTPSAAVVPSSQPIPAPIP
ncbi:MAG TPA: hypothetical protein V6C90_21910, partial [Coleofasciculaceae cyanobacterium]